MKKPTDAVNDGDKEIEQKRERSEEEAFLQKLNSRQLLERHVPRCRNCGAKTIRFRTKMQSWVCSGCGFAWSIEEEQKLQNLENLVTGKDYQIRYRLPLLIAALENAVKQIGGRER